MRRIPDWLPTVLGFAPWASLLLAPAISLTLWVCGVG